MGVIGEQSLQKYAKIINTAIDTKDAIIKTADFDDRYKEALKKHEQTKTQQEQEETFEFNPNEIEPLVSRNKFKDNLSVNLEGIAKQRQQDYEEDIIQFETEPNNEGREF